MKLTNLKVDLALRLDCYEYEHITLECKDIDDYIHQYNRDIRPRFSKDSLYAVAHLVDFDYDGNLICSYQSFEGATYTYQDDKYGTIDEVITLDNAEDLIIYISKDKADSFRIKHTEQSIRSLIPKDMLVDWAKDNGMVINFQA